MPHPFLAFWIYAAKFVSLLYQQQQRDAMGLVNYMVMDTLLLSVTSSAFSAATMLSPISIASPASWYRFKGYERVFSAISTVGFEIMFSYTERFAAASSVSSQGKNTASDCCMHALVNSECKSQIYTRSLEWELLFCGVTLNYRKWDN